MPTQEERPANRLERTFPCRAGEGEGAPEASPGNQNPGAPGAKEQKMKARRARWRPGNGADPPAAAPLATFKCASETTLGNGYLGSRIDEERSEMRYLV